MKNNKERINKIRKIWGDWERPSGQSNLLDRDWAAGVDWCSVPADEQIKLIAERSAAGVDNRNLRVLNFVMLGMESFGGGAELSRRTSVYALHNGAPLDCCNFEHEGQCIVLLNDGVADMIRHLSFFLMLTITNPEDPNFSLFNLNFERELWRRILLIEGQSMARGGRLWQPIRLNGPLQKPAEMFSHMCTAFALAHEMAHGLLREWSDPSKRTYRSEKYFLPEGWQNPGIIQEMVCDNLAALILIEAIGHAGFSELPDSIMYQKNFLVLSVMVFFWAVAFVDDQMFVKQSSSHPHAIERLHGCLGTLASAGYEEQILQWMPVFTSLDDLTTPKYRTNDIDVVSLVPQSNFCNFSPVLDAEDLEYLRHLNLAAEIYDTSAEFLYYATCLGDDNGKKLSREWARSIEIPGGRSEDVLTFVNDRVRCGRTLIWGILISTSNGNKEKVIFPDSGVLACDWVEEISGILPLTKLLVVERILWAAVRGREPGFWSQPARPIMINPKYVTRSRI